jgi:hypothetical protein
MKRSFAGLALTIFPTVLDLILLSTTLLLWRLTVVLAPLFGASFGPSLLQPGIKLSRQCILLFGRVGNLIVSGVLFYAAFAPLGAIQHLLGRDALRLRFDAKAPTYWIEHQTLGYFPRTTLVVEVVAFLKKRKKLWLIPIIALMMFLRIFVPRVSPTRTPSRFIYPLH